MTNTNNNALLIENLYCYKVKKAGASVKMFPPLLCLVLLFGLLPFFPLGIFPLPVLAFKERLNFWKQDATKLDTRRRLIDSFVNAITIFDDHILITFNYKEGEARIGFADIESSDLQSNCGPKVRGSAPRCVL